ncbi:MAG TPA: thioredoxin domain-containing protein [Gammaproteobacteria bacterium]|nr:thioredoxin domain-containing protein [Gammaproteobacteria bacterium]
MRRTSCAAALVVILTLVSIAPAFGASSPAGAKAPAPAALTRGEVVTIVRQEIDRAFALRDWHQYSRYIDEYRGADAEALFSLSALDRATAIGDARSPVRVIVYADYECPYCKLFESETSPKLHERFDSEALFLFRFFPLGIHGEIARSEAIAGACVGRTAGAQAFRRFTARIFAATGSNGKGTRDGAEEIAHTVLHDSGVHLDRSKLDQLYDDCVNGKTGAALIAPDAAFRGVTGTPTIFVVNTASKEAWRLAGAVPAWVFETLIGNVIAGRPGDSDWAIDRQRVRPPDAD